MDCERFAPAADCDPVFAAALADVAEQGVEVLVYGCAITTCGVSIDRPIPYARTSLKG
jgi:sugar fermentation stimulation protein A